VITRAGWTLISEPGRRYEQYEATLNNLCWRVSGADKDWSATVRKPNTRELGADYLKTAGQQRRRTCSWRSAEAAMKECERRASLNLRAIPDPQETEAQRKADWAVRDRIEAIEEAKRDVRRAIVRIAELAEAYYCDGSGSEDDIKAATYEKRAYESRLEKLERGK
jgi:hypothetical protein